MSNRKKISKKDARRQSIKGIRASVELLDEIELMEQELQK